MKKYRLLVILCTVVFFSSIALSQVEDNSPFMTANMIELSYDGTAWASASAMVSGIQIVTGTVTAAHTDHARRGTIITWEGQIGPPHTDMKASWKFDTGLLAAEGNRFYLRYRFGKGVELSPYSDPSDAVKLIGKPQKPVNKGAVVPSPG